MKASSNAGETNKKLWKPANDPSLEGKDENKVGRIQRKIGVLRDIDRVKNQKASSAKSQLS
jgi:hypothetical protein